MKLIALLAALVIVASAAVLIMRSPQKPVGLSPARFSTQLDSYCAALLSPLDTKRAALKVEPLIALRERFRASREAGAEQAVSLCDLLLQMAAEREPFALKLQDSATKRGATRAIAISSTSKSTLSGSSALRNAGRW
jgi:hypothetical protein